MNFIMSRQAMWLEAIEKRISATSAMLASMKGVKMSGLGDTLLASLQKLRVEEMRISKRFRKLLIWNMVFGKSKHSLSKSERARGFRSDTVGM
jgi:ATP-binding cassette subfamily C (CFTR/MRP) protein 1